MCSHVIVILYSRYLDLFCYQKFSHCPPPLHRLDVNPLCVHLIMPAVYLGGLGKLNLWRLVWALDSLAPVLLQGKESFRLDR